MRAFRFKGGKNKSEEAHIEAVINYVAYVTVKVNRYKSFWPYTIFILILTLTAYLPRQGSDITHISSRMRSKKLIDDETLASVTSTDEAWAWIAELMDRCYALRQDQSLDMFPVGIFNIRNFRMPPQPCERPDTLPVSIVIPQVCYAEFDPDRFDDQPLLDMFFVFDTGMSWEVDAPGRRRKEVSGEERRLRDRRRLATKIVDEAAAHVPPSMWDGDQPTGYDKRVFDALNVSTTAPETNNATANETLVLLRKANIYLSAALGQHAVQPERTFPTVQGINMNFPTGAPQYIASIQYNYFNRSDALEFVQLLRRSRWVNAGTRGLIVDIVVFNSILNTYGSTRIVIEQSGGQSIDFRIHLEVFDAPESSALSRFLLATDIILAVGGVWIVVDLVIHTWMQFVMLQDKSVFWSKWVLLNVALIVMLVLLFIQRFRRWAIRSRYVGGSKTTQRAFDELNWIAGYGSDQDLYLTTRTAFSLEGAMRLKSAM